MKGRRPIAVLIATMTMAATMALTAATASPAAATLTSFRGWEFDYSLDSINADGLVLSNVRYDGTKIFERISLPAMTVYYDNNACGPYIDRLAFPLISGPTSSRFTQDGVRWMSLGITDQIGNYVITQMYYFSEHGDLDLHMFSKGIQCNDRHDHYPFWRMDVDLAGSQNDVIKRQTASGMVEERTEFSKPATSAVNHGWEVHDTSTGDYLTIDFDDGNFGIPGEVIPETDYVNNMVYGLQARSSERRWAGAASRQFQGVNGEQIDDVVLAYRGIMPHSPSEGPNLWHSTGVRIKVNPSPTDRGAIGDRVTDASGSGVGGVAIDLFNSNRSRWLGSTTTDGGGRYQFAVAAGCYAVTFIAPAGRSFQTGRYDNRSVCVEAGQTINSIDAVLGAGSGGASIGDRVTWSAGGGAGQVSVDLFKANRVGDRIAYLESTTTASDGSYSFGVDAPGCYIVTFIAPTGTTFNDGSRWNSVERCVDQGDRVTDADVVLRSNSQGARIGDRVTNRSGAGVANVGIDLFGTAADGSRGRYLRSDRTDSNGSYGFEVSAGCYVVTFVAPTNRTFTVNNSRYYNRSVCISNGQILNTIDARLN